MKVTNANLLQPVSCMSAVWLQISQETTPACFKKAALLKSTVDSEPCAQYDVTEEDNCIHLKLFSATPVSFQDLRQWDKGVDI